MINRITWFNYKRNILVVPRVTVPRIVYPNIKLPKYTNTVLSSVDCPDMPNLVAVHEVKVAGETRYIYIHRL
jgi:hypothetical protein